MIARLLSCLMLPGIAVLILLVIGSALAAANSVPLSGVDNLVFPITANALKPPECAALNLANVVAGSGSLNGGAGNSLILGGSGADSIRAQNGDDCVLGGGGDDDVSGQGGRDVLLGGLGDDDLNGGAGNDECYGGGGNDTFARSCEVQIQ